MRNGSVMQIATLVFSHMHTSTDCTELIALNCRLAYHQFFFHNVASLLDHIPVRIRLQETARDRSR